VGIASGSCLYAAVMLTLIAARGAAGQAAAKEPGPPAECTGKPRHLEKFNTGFASGKQRADKLFAETDVNKDPKKLKKKLNRVLDRLHDHVREIMQGDSSDGRRCRVQGVADGFIRRLAELLGQCVLDGAHWAQFAANLYCELSIELDGLGSDGPFLRAPAGLCGTLFEAVCDAGFAYVATEGTSALSRPVQQFLHERAVALTPYPGCGPYTVAPYAAVYREAMNLDCAYSLP
jgi:hypothetical protein